MNYRKNEKQRLNPLMKEIFDDDGNGYYGKKENRNPKPFILLEPVKNLWEPIRQNVLDYFKDNNIAWWGSSDIPTGHILSSQIACLNHLFYLKDKEELATKLLKKIDPTIKKSCQIVDNSRNINEGFVGFEMTGNERLGKEKKLSRGENCTSIDALMLGEKNNGSKVLVLIEWKYTEFYGKKYLGKYKSGKISKSGEVRMLAYEHFLAELDCPIKHEFYNDLFYEPFYQMMRQTFLGWQMAKRKEYGADDWLHVDVIPKQNTELRNRITSPNLKSIGDTVDAVWKNILKDPMKYVIIDPEDLLKSISYLDDTQSHLTYLSKRYW